MGRFDEAAKKAKTETDELFEGDIKKLTTLDPAKINALFPNTKDRMAVSKLIRKVGKATSKIAAQTALKAFVASASVLAIKAAKKVILPVLVLALALLPVLAMAETMTFSQFLAGKAAETKALYSLTWLEDGEARHAGGAYVPINTLHSKDKKFDYLDWGIGMEEPEGSEKPRLIVPVMGNVIDIGRRIFAFRWAREHIRTTSLPKVWLGPIWHPPTKLSKTGLRQYVFIHNLGLGISARFSSFLPERKGD